MFIISITYIRPMTEIDALLTAHHHFLHEQYAAGVFLMSGRKVPRNGGVILADTADRADIEAIVQIDPFYVAGVAEYEITEFVPSITAEPFAIFQANGNRN
jgi:uncharacterized protein YciI